MFLSSPCGTSEISWKRGSDYNRPNETIKIGSTGYPKVNADTLFYLALFVFGVAVIIWQTFDDARRRRDVRQTVNWPTIEATVQSGQMEIVLTKGLHDVILPCFDFSYVVSGRTYQGRFSVGTPLAIDESIIPRTIGLNLVVLYDPQDPSIYYIPTKKIEGYDLGQRFGPQGAGFHPKDPPTREPGFYPKAHPNIEE